MQSGTTPDGLVLTTSASGRFASVRRDNTFVLTGDLRLGDNGVVLKTDAGELAVYFNGMKIGSVGAAPPPIAAPAAPETCSVQLTGYTQQDRHAKGAAFPAGDTSFYDGTLLTRGKSRMASGSLHFTVQCEEEVRMVVAFFKNGAWNEMGDEFKSAQRNVIVSSPVFSLPKDGSTVILGVRLRSDGTKPVTLGSMTLCASA